MKFSVLMSVYAKEHADYLSAALESVLGQTLPPNEIVLVEDGPLTDSLYGVIDAFDHRNPRKLKRVILKENHGLGVALNKGMQACSHEIIARMDADDIAAPDRFEKQIGFLVSNENIDMVGSNIAEYNDSFSELLSIREVPEKHEDIVRMIAKRSPFNHMSVVYKKSVVLASNGYEDCQSFEDYYLWCKMAQDGARFHNLQENLINMRTSEAISARRGGISYAKNVLSFQKRIYALGTIGRKRQLLNIAIRSTVALMPGQLRMQFYKKALREKAK